MKHPILHSLLVMGFTGSLLLTAMPLLTWGSPGGDVFQGLTQHIRAQIAKDKKAFSLADTCTTWFYRHMGKPPQTKAEVEKIHFLPISEEEHADCVKRYPQGLEAAREAFGQTQQELSFSLTFFQMALVGDGDDNQEYSTHELQDVLHAFNLPEVDGQPSPRSLQALTGLFDTFRKDIRFQTLMDGMQTLMDQGYRFTETDQTALNKELG